NKRRNFKKILKFLLNSKIFKLLIQLKISINLKVSKIKNLVLFFKNIETYQIAFRLKSHLVKPYHDWFSNLRGITTYINFGISRKTKSVKRFLGTDESELTRFIIFIHIRTFVYIWTNFCNPKINSNKKEIRKNNINKIKMKY
ncbi:hypothetical protein BpHYR1_047406, partial [Brachionus plicatilis]